jgi:integrase
MHKFRHAAASVFIIKYPPKRVQTLLGHSSIKMTYDVYGHLFSSPEDDKAVMRDIQKLFESK